MKAFKYMLLFMGILIIVFTIINSLYEKSILTNKWSFVSGAALIWLALDKRLQKKFEEF